MTLVEHLRELRGRMFKSACAIVVAFVVAWVLYDHILDLLREPYDTTVRALVADRGLHVEAVTSGIAGPFLLQTKVSLTASIVLASPVWLYQIWAFVLPGLHRNEKKWTLLFVAIAGPLFMGGVALGYYVMPKGIEVLLGFTPQNVTNLVDLETYLSFILRVLLVFGVSFEIPLFVVMLNLAGVVTARQLGRWRAWIIFATFVFAAVATPSTDPITMCLLAVPMVTLFGISEVIARIVDRRRRRRSGDLDYSSLGDDDTSPL